MSRYRGPVSRLCRREGMKLYLKGAKCYTKKCPFERRPTPPGQHGVRRRKMSRVRRPAAREAEDAAHLLASTSASSSTTSTRPSTGRASPARTCCACSRRASTTSSSGWASASSRAQARQLVAHGHFTVNGRVTNDPVVPGQARATGSRSARRAASPSTSRRSRDALRGAQRPDWLSVDADKLTGSVTALPRRDQMPLELNEQLVVEFYSR